jgi:hypothetical protein
MIKSNILGRLWDAKSIKPGRDDDGLHDPIVPGQETKNLFTLLKKTGVADISINWQNSGHELISEEIRNAKDWLLHAISPNKKN